MPLTIAKRIEDVENSLGALLGIAKLAFLNGPAAFPKTMCFENALTNLCHNRNTPFDDTLDVFWKCNIVRFFSCLEEIFLSFFYISISYILYVLYFYNIFLE